MCLSVRKGMLQQWCSMLLLYSTGWLECANPASTLAPHAIEQTVNTNANLAKMDFTYINRDA